VTPLTVLGRIECVSQGMVSPAATRSRIYAPRHKLSTKLLTIRKIIVKAVC